MRFLGINIAIATWLLVSAFLLPHTPMTAAMNVVAALLVALFAALTFGRPGARFAITAVAVLLAVGALLLPDMPGPAALSNGLVAAALAALSLVAPHVSAESKPATSPGSDI